MEKLIYPLWKKPEQTDTQFRDQLLKQLSPTLLAPPLASNLRGLRICVVDDDVAPAAQYRMIASKPAADGLISIWVNSYLQRQAYEQQIEQYCSHFHCYQVTESEPLTNNDYDEAEGQRSPGMNQVVFLQKPPRLSREEWIDIWHNSHTQIAIDTQSSFGYRQNVITRGLSYAAPHYDAIIEENFPNAAISSREAFYDAQGDQALFTERQNTMIESCMRFIDFDKIDCIPMSEYIMKRI